ncbi:MAG: hypothetical protein Q7R82_01460 [Candidatus Daviesbacteria bacterium]|nr:hypothetical protein [Candidatus Daviesbacteria bacterium]
MEKALLKTLIYADIFDYPLKINEIHKWLIGPSAGRAGKKVTLRQIEKALSKLNQELRISSYRRYYFLRKRDGIVAQRLRREKQSAQYLRKAKILSQILKIIPWIKLVGVSGGLALHNASKKDDIDLFIIIGRNRLWISRLLTLGLLSLIGQRRKVGEKGRKIAGKLCFNILLEEDRLEQENKDIFVAHEILQMKVLWQRDGVYSKYLEDNSWAFKFLQNWVSDSSLSLRGSRRGGGRSNLARINSISRLLRFFWSLAMTGIEKQAKWWQLKIMQKPKGMERIEEGALYFHPEDCRLEVLKKYEQKLRKLISP